MRILMNALNAGNRSGTGRYIFELAKVLLNSTGNDEFLFLWPENLPAPVPDKEACLVRKSSSPAIRLYHEHIGADRAARNLMADIVHHPTGIGSRFSKTPVILTVHDICFFRHPEWFSQSRSLYYRTVMTAGIRKAARIIADSQATANDIMEIMGIPASRIDVVSLGVDSCFAPASEEQVQAIRKQYGLPETFFLFVGTIEPRKNLTRLISAWRQVRSEVPPLVMAGRYGWGGSMPADKEIIRLDHVPGERLPALYSAATAFVWPSLMEGFGLPPLEAMACGTPVLTSNTSSLPEVASDAAIMVDPLDVDAIASGMIALAQNQDLREELRQKGLKRTATFTWRETAEKTIAAYKKVSTEIK
jgi:glycosyltransferase involved in cell wall biosynthesis